MFKKIDFYYFSGTGNTFLVVQKMKDVFESRGIKVNLHKIEKTAPQDVKSDGVIGLAFPVALQSTFPFLWDFFKSLPDSDGTPVFMVDTMQGFSGGIVGPLKRVLNRKGYKTIGAVEIIMPSNILRKKPVSEKDERKVEKGLEKAEKFALDLIDGKASWGRVPVLSDIVKTLSQWKAVWRFFRKVYGFKVDESKCIECDICVKVCPVHNVVLKGDGFPVHLDNCNFCMRCISFCPTEAIFSKVAPVKYRAVKVSQILAGD